MQEKHDDKNEKHEQVVEKMGKEAAGPWWSWCARPVAPHQWRQLAAIGIVPASLASLTMVDSAGLAGENEVSCTNPSA